MNLSKLNRINCSKYSDMDDVIIRKASSYGLPLIGGTAIEIWGNHSGITGFRKRSDNDLDFIAPSLGHHAEFDLWCRDNVDSSKVKLDVFELTSVPVSVFKRHIRKINGVLVMDVPFLIASKLGRFNGNDRGDIKYLFNLTTPEELEAELPDLLHSEEEVERLNSLIEPD